MQGKGRGGQKREEREEREAGSGERGAGSWEREERGVPELLIVSTVLRPLQSNVRKQI